MPPKTKLVKPPAPPFVCAGHVERDTDQPEVRAQKHIANALDPRGTQTSALIDVLTRIADCVCSQGGGGLANIEASLLRIAVAVEKIAAGPPPEKATDLGGSASGIPKAGGFPPTP